MRWSSDYWRNLVESRNANAAAAWKAVEFRAALSRGKSHPVVLLCTDGAVEAEYVVEVVGEVIHTHGHIYPKALFNDYVVGKVGNLIGAPIPQVDLIDIPYELIRINFGMAHQLEGIAHGSRLLRSTFDAETVLHLNQLNQYNLERFALLAVLFGLVHVAEDLQFIYDRGSSRLVHSVDHGDVFPNGPNWRIEGLGSAPAPRLEASIVSSCGFSARTVSGATRSLTRLDDQSIASFVADPPVAWPGADSRADCHGGVSRQQT